MLRNRLMLLASFALLATCLLATPAFALSFDPIVDFRDQSVWGSANYQTTHVASQNGIEITLSADPAAAKLYQDGRDGIGVRYSYERDEIEANERLHVLFDVAVDLSAIYVSDLFVESGYTEQGYYRVQNGSWLSWELFDATLPGTGSNGEHVIAFNPAVAVTGLSFKAPGKLGGQGHEFSLLGLDVSLPPTSVSDATPVPEPSALALFCMGTVTVAAATRRRRHSNPLSQ